MTRLLAVDPGNTTGFALFEDTTLTRCGVVRSSALHMLPDADELVIEVPRMRRRHPRPDDVLQVAALAGMVSGHFNGSGQCKHVTQVTPSQWKKNLPKNICWDRVRRCLWPQELKITEAPLGRLDHNARDAIGIGLWHLGRFQT